jgi:hypothetical protein
MITTISYQDTSYSLEFPPHSSIGFWWLIVEAAFVEHRPQEEVVNLKNKTGINLPSTAPVRFAGIIADYIYTGST